MAVVFLVPSIGWFLGFIRGRWFHVLRGFGGALSAPGLVLALGLALIPLLFFERVEAYTSDASFYAFALRVGVGAFLIEFSNTEKHLAGPKGSLFLPFLTGV